MRALFIGGLVDNTELDLESTEPSMHYPPNGGGGHSRYRLHQIGRRDGTAVYAVYGAPDLADDAVTAVAEERQYARRFDATVEAVAH